MKTKNYWKILFVMMWLASCATKPKPKTKVKLKNQKICIVAGDIRAGADCTNTLGGFNSSLTTEQVIKVLEGDPSDNEPPWVFMPLEDFAEMKTALDLACKAADSCTTVIR